MEIFNEARFLDNKLRIFISSRCKDENYRKVRSKIKEKLEASGIASVYLFEGQGASTLTAENEYLYALRDSDVCIFLIDNKDGAGEGVLKEIDTAKKYNIKSLFYFCDERSKKKTPVEEGLTGDSFAKYKTVHSFNDLVMDSARDLMNDIIRIYHYYCKEYLNDPESSETDILQIHNFDYEKSSYLVAPKTVLKKLNKSKRYIQILTTGLSRHDEGGNETNKLDEWCVRFLQVMFEGKSISDFNVDMFLEDTKSFKMSENYIQIVSIRWKAIEAYFMGDVEKSISEMEESLKLAKKQNAPSWVIDDILIDLRNQNILLCEEKGSYSFNNPDYQEELDKMDESVYYPLLDRIDDSLHEAYIDEFMKRKLESPYTINFGSNVDTYTELLASDLIISMTNGSLTHILDFYEEVKKFLFYMCNKYSNWTFRRDMLKMSIYRCNENEVKKIIDAYPEILNNLDEADAEDIMAFCNLNPVPYKRFISTMIALGIVGYYLKDEQFKDWSTSIVNEIKSRLIVFEPNRFIGRYMFKMFSGISERISQDILSEICCLVMENNLRQYYDDMFDFIYKGIHLDKMSEAFVGELMENLIKIIESPNDREILKRRSVCLVSLRKQSRTATKNLDEKIRANMPEFYNSVYKLDTTNDDNTDMPLFVSQYINSIHHNNVTQGLNGVYAISDGGEIKTIYNIIIQTEVEFTDELIDSLIQVLSETLLKSKEGIGVRLESISLLILIINKYQNSIERNNKIFSELYGNKGEIVDASKYGFPTNVKDIALDIAVEFLYAVIGYDTYNTLLNLISLLQDDDATTISVVTMIDEYLTSADIMQLSKPIESLILQYAIQWLQSHCLDIRWHATSILLSLLQNVENADVINNQLIMLVGNDNYYIKNLILRNVFRNENIFDDTREYILMKCKSDANYLVRYVYQEEIEKHIQ